MPDVVRYVAPTGEAPFDTRFDGLRDSAAKVRILSAIAKLRAGLKPDLKPVGDGVHEARIACGPGYRLYFGNDGATLVVLLLCGDKRTQEKDIAMAKAHWAAYRTGRSHGRPS